MSVTFGFLGAGRMATALARGFLAAGLTSQDRVSASDPSSAAREAFAAATGVQPITDNGRVVEQSDVLVLAVKPQTMGDLLAELRGRVTARHLVISIAAGVTLSALSTGLGAGPRLVRVMPNTPCLVGQGASAFATAADVPDDDAALVERLLSAVGRAYRVEEKSLDAVTGLSGSGPAYVFEMIAALADGGEHVGLSRPLAQALAAQTVLGAAQMVLQGDQDPMTLKQQVMSPGGTTVAGLGALESHGFRAAVASAVEAATRRSIELGKPK